MRVVPEGLQVALPHVLGKEHQSMFYMKRFDLTLCLLDPEVGRAESGGDVPRKNLTASVNTDGNVINSQVLGEHVAPSTTLLT